MVDSLKDLLEDRFHLCLAKALYRWIVVSEVGYPLATCYTDIEGV